MLLLFLLLLLLWCFCTFALSLRPTRTIPPRVYITSISRVDLSVPRLASTQNPPITSVSVKFLRSCFPCWREDRMALRLTTADGRTASPWRDDDKTRISFTVGESQKNNFDDESELIHSLSVVKPRVSGLLLVPTSYTLSLLLHSARKNPLYCCCYSFFFIVMFFTIIMIIISSSSIIIISIIPILAWNSTSSDVVSGLTWLAYHDEVVCKIRRYTLRPRGTERNIAGSLHSSW